MLLRAACCSWILVALLGAGLCRAEEEFDEKPPIPAGKHCLGESRIKLLLDHTLAGSINPLGLENQFRLGACIPLIRRPGLLFDFTNLEIGAVNYISPTHIHQGGYVNLTPLSILVLRAEVTGAYIWPLPLPGAGYIRLTDYTPFTNDTLNPKDPPQPPFSNTNPPQATDTFAFRGLLGATLQGLIPFGKGVGLIVVDAFAGEYWRVRGAADGDFFYVARRDLILRATGDWLLSNSALAVVNIPLTRSENYVLRVGPNDELEYVPASGYLANLVAGVVAFLVKDAGNLAHNLEVFVRAGGYTHHGFRTGASIQGGLDVIYDLTPAKKYRPRSAPAAPPQ